MAGVIELVADDVGFHVEVRRHKPTNGFQRRYRVYLGRDKWLNSAWVPWAITEAEVQQLLSTGALQNLGEVMIDDGSLAPALAKEDGFGDFGRIETEDYDATIHYIYRDSRVWSSRRSWSREQWITIINFYLARDDEFVARLSAGGSEPNGRFVSIEVRREVWRRDEGRCTECGSQEKLEFDHIIPIAMGGNNTARNIQLLCESCNRQKGATLG
jgi:hypothetical protein